jgi:hypothetical protein
VRRIDSKPGAYPLVEAVMGYGLILPVAAIVLTVRYVGMDRASTRSKRVVGGITLTSLVIGVGLPSWYLVGAVLQLGVCVYVIFYQIVTEELDKPEEPRSRDVGAPEPDVAPDRRPR